MKRIWIYIGLIIFTSCVKEVDWTMPENGTQYIVVDGIITNEAKIQTIDIHYSMPGLNDMPLPLSGADVIINNEDFTFQLSEDPEQAGTYKTDSVVVGSLNKNYSLLILHQDKIFSAQAYMVAGKSFPELQYSKNADNELYHIDYVASAFEAEDPAMWEILIDWSTVAGYENAEPGSCRKRLLFYTLPTLDVSQIFAPIVEQISFPAGTVIDERRYSLSPDHAGFIRSLLLETDWQGGVYPTDPANVNTNLSDGALGFFGVCALNSLSLTITPQKKLILK